MKYMLMIVLVLALVMLAGCQSVPAEQASAYLLPTVLVLSVALLLALFLFWKYKRLDKELIDNQNKLNEAVLAAQEASRAKTAFLANMSHEIRTPMHGIIGFSELALDENISLETKEDYLKKIRSSAEGLLQIIDDILDISKIEAGKVDLENIPFDIHEIFRTCQTIITPTALEKGISLYCYAEPSVGKRLLGDPTRLNQVLLNLLSNAVKFTNTGMVKLLAEIVSTTEDSVTMRFEVKDSGIGMTHEQIEKIFNPFMQADTTTTRKYGGTGLGLAITKNIIELMGGQLLVKSEPGLGSLFTFELIFSTLYTPNSVPIDENAANKYEKPLFKGEILLCEDNEVNRQVILDNLRRVGLDAFTAVNGREGVEAVKRRMQAGEKPFDLILMDIHMPVMDGMEAAQAIHQLGCSTPIAALTANVMVNDRSAYQSNHMLDYLAKPFKSHELWALLAKYLPPLHAKAVKANEAAIQEAAIQEEDINEAAINEKKQRQRILTSFVEDQQATVQNIRAALAVDDVKLAHRLAHTLKGLAGLIDKPRLQETAKAVEMALSDGKALASAEQLQELDLELNKVLAELANLLTQRPPKRQRRALNPDSLDREKTDAMLKKLEALLKDNDSDCLYLTAELWDIPGFEALAEQIEAYDFILARQTLAGIKQDLGCEW